MIELGARIVGLFVDGVLGVIRSVYALAFIAAVLKALAIYGSKP